MPAGETRILRATTHGAVIGFIVVTSVAAALGAALGAPLAVALGLGAFVGFWGGVGFGGMFSGTLAMTRVQHGASSWAESTVVEGGPDAGDGDPGPHPGPQVPAKPSVPTQAVKKGHADVHMMSVLATASKAP